MATPTIPSLIGPLVSRDAMAALGAPFDRYDAVFDQWAAAHAAEETSPGAFEAYYYGRDLVLYAAAHRIMLDATPNTTLAASYRARARAMLAVYRDGYLAPNHFGAPPHEAFVEGLACNILDPEETPENRAKSRAALSGLAGTLWQGYALGGNAKGWGKNEGRIAGRVLQAFLFAELLGVPSYEFVGAQWPPPLPMPTWKQLLTDTLPHVLGLQDPDGAIRPDGYCNQQCNFSTCILNDVLIQYYEHFEPDPRIPPFIARSVSFLRTQYLPDVKAFQYMEAQCDTSTGVGSDSKRPAGWKLQELNGLIVNSFAWHAKMTGTPDPLVPEIIGGMLDEAYLAGPKQFNQCFCDSYRAAAYLAQTVPRAEITVVQAKAAVAALDKVVGPSGRESKSIKTALLPARAFLAALLASAPTPPAPTPPATSTPFEIQP
jgi:hypothetical protein